MANSNVYLNGQIVPADRATVSVFDAAFLHGASAFTTMLAHNSVVFRLDRHLKRLMDTVELLGLQTDAELARPAALTDATYDLLKANEFTEARLRITLTPGTVGNDRPTTLITAEPVPDYPGWWYEKGIPVVVASFKQSRGDVTVGYKTGCYLARVLARQEAAAKGAEDALWFTTDNFLAESCFSNVFLALDGQLFTPPRDTPVLPGVVRGAAIEICAQLSIRCCDDRNLTVREMLAAEEMFLTSSVMGIRPVVRIEQHAVGDEKPGTLTVRIMEAYRELLDRECTPAPAETKKESHR